MDSRLNNMLIDFLAEISIKKILAEGKIMLLRALKGISEMHVFLNGRMCTRSSFPSSLRGKNIAATLYLANLPLTL